MSLLSELTATLDSLNIPIETGVFTDTAPAQYAVSTPLSDTFGIFSDNLPDNEIQEVRISLFDKGNYMETKNNIISALLSADITITDRRYIGYENDTGYHHYAIDVAKLYEMEV